MSRTGQFIYGVVILFALFEDSARTLLPPQVKADFDGNGRLDAAVVDSTGAAVSIFLRAPDGRLVLTSKYCLKGAPGAITSADLNGNGSPDLAITGGPVGTVWILLNWGDGTFRSPQTYHVGVLNPRLIVVSDANGDGKLDLMVSDVRGNQSILLGNGDGSFSSD